MKYILEGVEAISKARSGICLLPLGTMEYIDVLTKTSFLVNYKQTTKSTPKLASDIKRGIFPGTHAETIGWLGNVYTEGPQGNLIQMMSNHQYRQHFQFKDVPLPYGVISWYTLREATGLIRRSLR
jgi:hypothetical protein